MDKKIKQPILRKPTAEMDEFLRRSGDGDYHKASAAQRQLAKALELPLRKGVLKGDNLAGIFEKVYFAPGTSVEFPLDFLTPSNVGQFVAYVIPSTGKLPRRTVEGDYLMVPTYEIGARIDWPLRYAEHARWDIVGRALQVMEAQFVLKLNRDGWHVLLAAGAGRNLVTYDGAGTSGLFTKRLVALMRNVMRRNAGGNYTSMGQGKLTDLFISPEGINDAFSWDITQVDDITRREIYLSDGDGPTRIFGVNIHILDELGESQEYQTYYSSVLGGTYPTDKVELVVGLDLANRDSFLMPVRKEISIYEDVHLFQERRAGLFGFTEVGFSCLNSIRILLGAF